MKNEELFEEWKKVKRHVEVDWKFKQRVINAVHRYERNRQKSRSAFEQFVSVLYGSRLAKSGLIAVSAGAGIVRMVLIIYMFLG